MKVIVTVTGETVAEIETETGIGIEEIVGGHAVGIVGARAVVTEATALEKMIVGTGERGSHPCK